MFYIFIILPTKVSLDALMQVQDKTSVVGPNATVVKGTRSNNVQRSDEAYGEADMHFLNTCQVIYVVQVYAWLCKIIIFGS